MAENKIDSTVIKRTQDTLGKYVKKPPLTEKLLKKPPFRFLFDVFSVVRMKTFYSQSYISFKHIFICRLLKKQAVLLDFTHRRN